MQILPRLTPRDPADTRQPATPLHDAHQGGFLYALTGRLRAVSGAIAVRFLRCVPTKTAADAKLGTAHVIDPSLEIPGWGFFFLAGGADSGKVGA